MEVPTKEPSSIQPATTVKWKKTFTDYAYDDGYTTRYYTISGNNGSATVTGAYADGTWTFTLTAANNTLAKGTYKLAGYVEKGSGASLERYCEFIGMLEVSDDVSTASATDQRTILRQQLDAVEQAILNYFDDDVPVEEISIKGQALRRTELQKLQNIKKQLQRDLRIEERKENLRNGRRVGSQILADIG